MAPQSFLLTRPAAQSARFAAELRARYGAATPIIISPVICPVYLKPALPDRPFVAIVLTSESGAEGARQLSAEGVSLPAAAYCVGDRTANAAKDAGFAARSAHGDATALLEMIRAQQPLGPLLYLRGDDSRGDVVDNLRSSGIEAYEAIVYKQESQLLMADAKTCLDAANPVILPLFSPRSAALLAAQGPFLAPLLIAALSPAVAEAAAALPNVRLTIASHPDAPGLLRAIDLLVAQGGNP